MAASREQERVGLPYLEDATALLQRVRSAHLTRGLFEAADLQWSWYDPATATGLVEPMRTEDDHQRRGLARHVLTTGIDLLARAGAARIKIIVEHDNPAARNLYLGVGFEPVKQTVIASGRTDAGRHPS
jgi:GNAT superfamily N-acetyltransferase